MIHNKKKLGNWGEHIAVEKLKQQGYEIQESNYYTKFGEIDIIAKEKNQLVFIEVKTRSNNYFGEALESVTQKKMQRFMRAIEIYLKEKNLEDILFRIDIVTLDKQNNGNWKFQLIQDIC